MCKFMIFWKTFKILDWECLVHIKAYISDLWSQNAIITFKNVFALVQSNCHC